MLLHFTLYSPLTLQLISTATCSHCSGSGMLGIWVRWLKSIAMTTVQRGMSLEEHHVRRSWCHWHQGREMLKLNRALSAAYERERERENSSEMSLRKQHWTMNSSFPSIHLPWQQCHIVRLGNGDGLISGWGLCDQRFNHTRPFWAVCYCTAMLLFRVWMCTPRKKRTDMYSLIIIYL